MEQRTVDILLVEDDEAIRLSLYEALVEEGYRVATAGHGGTAAALLAQGLQPGLILLDLMMPVMDGWQLLRHLGTCRHMAAIPVVVLSAARDALPQGACRYLRKPVDLDVLLKAVAQACAPPAAGPGERPGSAAASTLPPAGQRGASGRPQATPACRGLGTP